MPRHAGLTILFISFLTVSATAGQSSPPPLRSMPTPEPKQSEIYQATPIDAKDFIAAAGDSGMTKVALARVAADKASSERVKQFAARLQKEHSLVYAELVALAAKKDVPAPAISPGKQAVVDQLDDTNKAVFDRVYMTQMVEDHKKFVALFTRGTASPDADIKTFADRTLPTTKLHLSEAEEILKGLGPSSSPAPRTPPTAQ